MIFVIIISLLVLLLIVVYLISTLVGLIRARGVPFVPLGRKQIQEVCKAISINTGDKIVDLGCGDARVLRAFEKLGANNLSGFEINFFAYSLAKIKNKFFRSKAKIYFKNFKKVDFSEYNLVFCYLFPKAVNVLKEKFDKELKPGTKVISYGFKIENWHQPEIIGRIFIYNIV